MEEKNESKSVRMTAAKAKEALYDKVKEQAPQKLSYEELNQACAEMSQQLQNQSAHMQKMYKQMQQMEYMLQTRRIDYLFKVLELQANFHSDFIVKCSEEIEESLTIPEEEQKESEKEN